MDKLFFLFLLLSFLYGNKISKEISIKSTDNVQIHGDIIYSPPQKKPFVIFLHQDNWNSQEYKEISKKFYQNNFNSIAIDLRFGNSFRGKKNLTRISALENKKKTDYITSLIDIKATIKYIRKNYRPSTIILFGSSISGSLALIEASRNKHVSMVLSYSPGEYFINNHYLEKNINISEDIPVFITGTKDERVELIKILKKIKSQKKTLFTPTKQFGIHGSKSLWKRIQGNEEYWNATINFLSEYFPFNNLE